MDLKRSQIFIFVFLLSLNFVLAVPESQSIFFSQNDGWNSRADCVNGNSYVNYSNVEIHGIINSPEENKIVDIKYKRDSKDWETSNWDAPADATEEWWSRITEPEYFVGEHVICVRATDEFNSRSNVECCNLCIDTEVPGQASNLVLNSSLYFTWAGASDSGCAGIIGYGIEVYEETTGLIKTNISQNPYYQLDATDLISGATYYLKVYATDKSGNKGALVESSHFTYSPQQTCSEQGGDICDLNEYCPENELVASDSERCCNAVCETREFNLCSECGEGLFNICDESECYSILEKCYFNGLSQCASCSQTTCADYSEEDCMNDSLICNLNCQWNGNNCIETPEQCSDGIDNDNDGAVDSMDFSCQGGSLNENEFFALCQDGVDNDGDSSIDYPEDSDCITLQDNDERENNALVIDHTAVEIYDDIPDYYLNEAKKYWMDFAGESHSLGYRKGLSLLNELNPKYSVIVTESGAPESYREDAMRSNRFVRTIYNSWGAGAGEDVWYTTNSGKDRIKLHLDYANSNNYGPSVLGFGWCWDMTWHNSPGGTIDSKYNTRWAGSSVGGPDGDLRWGLDDEDYELTGNHVNMNWYLNSTQAYSDYAKLNNSNITIIFTTGPVDGYSGEAGYQRQLKQDKIRDYVKNSSSEVLFDYADILEYNNEREHYIQNWNGKDYSMIHPDNMMDYDGNWSLVSYIEDGDHIGEVGALRLGKAQWVLAAILAGWDGTPEIILCSDNDEDGYDNCAIGEQGDDGLEKDCNDNLNLTNPRSEESCNNLDDNCNMETDENLTQQCGVEIGECDYGTEICQFGQWVNCSAKTPSPELCDNLDNDCDSFIDDSLIQLCYTGAFETEGVGICSPGTQTCILGIWDNCKNETLPQLEVCDINLLDENCDGSVNENCPCIEGETKNCGSDIGACEFGTQTCSSSGSWSSCVGDISSTVELCDTIDNDCDGITIVLMEC